MAYGNRFSRSSSSATGAISPSANSRTVLQMSWWSSERSKSMAVIIATALLAFAAPIAHADPAPPA